MKIYIDINDGFKCYTTNTGNLLECDESFFDGKCPEFIEGYRCKPEDYEWVIDDEVCIRADCKVITPWKNYEELERAQFQYEIAQYEAALTAIENALEVTT